MNFGSQTCVTLYEARWKRTSALRMLCWNICCKVVRTLGPPAAGCEAHVRVAEVVLEPEPVRDAVPQAAEQLDQSEASVAALHQSQLTWTMAGSCSGARWRYISRHEARHSARVTRASLDVLFVSSNLLFDIKIEELYAILLG